MTIQKYLDLFEYQKDETSDNPRFKEGFWSFNPQSTGSGELPEYRAMSDLIRESDLDEDSAYTFTVEVLQAIKEIIEEQEEKIYSFNFLEDYENLSSYSEAPIYNSELTAWLAKGSNYTFVDDAVNEFGWNDSPDGGIIHMIQTAYTLAWEEHYFKVLEVVKQGDPI